MNQFEKSELIKAGIRKNKYSPAKWYYGSDTFDSIQTDESNMFNLGVADYSSSGPAERTFTGDGEILFRLTDKTREIFYSILPGTYTSTIYFHVVADL